MTWYIGEVGVSEKFKGTKEEAMEYAQSLLGTKAGDRVLVRREFKGFLGTGKAVVAEYIRMGDGTIEDLAKMNSQEISSLIAEGLIAES